MKAKFFCKSCGKEKELFNDEPEALCPCGGVMQRIRVAQNKAERQLIRKERLLDIADGLTPGQTYSHRELMLLIQRKYGASEGTAISYVESLQAMNLLKVTGVRFVELNYDELLKQLIKPKT